MKLLCLSDIHGKLSSLSAVLDKVLGSQRVDLITLSGDISHFGQGQDVERALNVIDRTKVPYCYVLGNCDPIEHREGVQSEGLCLESSSMSYLGVTMIGSGGATPTPFSTPFEIGEDELVGNISRNMEASNSSNPNALMLVLHNPPTGEVVDRTRAGLHVGSPELRKFIIKASPLLVQCGHIHEAIGVERIGRTLVFNPGPILRGSYALVDIDNVKGDASIAHGTL